MMSQATATRTVVVTNPMGLHLRAADLIVKTVRQYDCKVALIRDRQRVEADGVLQLLALGAEQGVQLDLEAIGPDAESALDAVVKLFVDNFGE